MFIYVYVYIPGADLPGSAEQGSLLGLGFVGGKAMLGLHRENRQENGSYNIISGHIVGL